MQDYSLLSETASSLARQCGSVFFLRSKSVNIKSETFSGGFVFAELFIIPNYGLRYMYTLCKKYNEADTVSTMRNECKKCFHLNCLQTPDIPDVNKFLGLSWKCTICIKKPPVGNMDLGPLLAKLNDIQADIAQVKSKQEDMVRSIEFYGNKIDDFSIKINEFENKLKIVPTLQVNIQANATDISNLKSQVDNLQQQLRLNNLEINGIPEASNENILDIVNRLFVALDINGDNIIDTCHRVPHMKSDNKTPKSIIVKLTRRSYKDAIIAAIRKQKGVSADKIGFNDVNRKIYINDHLTPSNQLLYKKTRDLCKPKNISCWTRDCKIFLKHPQTARNMFIDCEATLLKVFNNI